MATFDEARQCPKCEQPGKVGHTNSIPRSRNQQVQIICENPRCRWYNTSWTVTRRPDGSVPDPDPRGRVKDHPPMSGGGIIKANMEELQRLLEAQREGGAEI